MRIQKQAQAQAQAQSHKHTSTSTSTYIFYYITHVFLPRFQRARPLMCCCWLLIPRSHPWGNFNENVSEADRNRSEKIQVDGNFITHHKRKINIKKITRKR